jgi:tetratricopeptide (TPR) repeat protein
MRYSLTIRSLLLVTALLSAPVVQAMTANEYFADGNRLFREDLYWAALLRYRQAAEQGMDTPLLHYNTGIAHYRAGQHVRAREALLTVVDDPSLGIAAQYSLGLNAWALGETEEALRWFRRVRDQDRNAKLRQFAAAAISRIRAAEEKPTDYEALVEEREEKRNFATLRLRALVGYGNDSNIFRSPDRPYIDYADPNRPIVTPMVQSGAFVPVSFSARYQINSLPFEGFYGEYRLAGRYYVDEALENGNEYLHEFRFGSDYEREKDDRKRRVQSAFAVARKDEVYYDPDDGTSRDVDGEGIEDRMNYLRYGPQLSARQSGEKLSFGTHLKAELWDYEDTEVVPEYDHEYFVARLYGQYKFTQTSLLRVTGEWYSRRFGDRPAYDLDGQQRIGNPGIRYDYLALGLRARQRITNSMWFGFDIERTERKDQYVGYYDYTRDSFGMEFHWSPGQRFDFEASGVYSLYDFPNAFAFHEPTLPSRTQESLDATVRARYHFTRHLSVEAKAVVREVVSNDIRIQYDRTQYQVGIRWQQ